MVERLYLNRPQLRLERREIDLHARHSRAHSAITTFGALLKTSNIDGDTALALFDRIMERLGAAREAEERVRGATPYQMADVRRP
jgi:hypothetical protein